MYGNDISYRNLVVPCISLQGRITDRDVHVYSPELGAQPVVFKVARYELIIIFVDNFVVQACPFGSKPSARINISRQSKTQVNCFDHFPPSVIESQRPSCPG